MKSNKNQSKEKDLKYQLLNKLKIQRLPIALAQVKAGNNSKKLLNEIIQIAYSLYQQKEVTKKGYNNIIKSIQI